MHCFPLSASLNWEAWDVNGLGGSQPWWQLGLGVGGGGARVRVCTDACLWSCSGRSLQTDVSPELICHGCSEVALYFSFQDKTIRCVPCSWLG